MSFENRPDAVIVSSTEGDVLAPGKQARDAARQEADATGKPVTIRDAITDKVLATVRPTSDQ